MEEVHLLMMTNQSQLSKQGMPEDILLNVTLTPCGKSWLVTVFKKPTRFQEVPMFVFNTDSKTQPAETAPSEKQVCFVLFVCLFVCRCC